MFELIDSSKNEAGISAETASGFITVQNEKAVLGIEYEANVVIDRDDCDLTLRSIDVTKSTIMTCLDKHGNQIKPTYKLNNTEKEGIAYLIKDQLKEALEDCAESVNEELDELGE